MPVYTTTLPNGQSIQVMGPTGATPEDIQQAALQIAAQRTPVLSPDSGKRNYSLGTAASKGFSRGAERIKSAFGDVIPAMAGKALGFDEYAERQMKEAQASQELVNRKYRAELQSYKDVQSIGDAIKFGIETVSEQIPNLATMVVPGAGLGVAARMGALGSKVTPGAAQGIGVYLGSYALNTPEVFQNIYDETGELATGTSLLFGAAAASLDSVLPSAILKNITPLQKLAISKAVIKKSGARPGLVESVFKGLAKGAATEGVTEGMQEAISISAENFVAGNPQIFDSEDWDRIMESSVRGSVAGGTFRGVSEPFGRAPAAPTPEPTPEPTITPTKTEVAAATEATALAEATAATEAAAVAKTEADIKAIEAIEKTKVTQAAELGLDIEEDGQTATRSELVDPKNEDLGEQDVVYNWDSIKLTWEKQDELTPTDTSDRTQIAGRSDEVLVKSKDDQDAPPPTKPKRGEVGSDRTPISTTGRRKDVSDVALTDKEKVLKNEIARKYLPRIEEAREKLRPIEEAEDAKVRGDQAATYKLMDKQEARRQKAFKKINDEGMAEFEARRKEAVSDAALTDREKETNKKYPADLVLARDPYSLAGSLEKVPAESSEDYQKRLNNYLNNRIEGETEPEFNKRTGLKDIVSTSAKTGKPRKAQMLTDKLGDVQYAGEKRVRALSQIPPGTKIHWDGKDWIVDTYEITDQDRRAPGTMSITLIQRGGARFSATSNKEGMVKLGDTEVMQVTSNLADADTMGTNLSSLTSENTSGTIKDKPLLKTPATLGWQLTEKEANADKKLKKNKTAKQLEKEEARRSGEEIEETVAETWEEMSSSKVPFDKLSAENQLRLEEAREDLGITAELVDEIDQEVAPTQEQKVKQTLKKAATPLTIKEIAEQTDILEPNVRRITGQGAKTGKFERVDKGVYTLTTPDGKKIAHIEVGDAVNVLPKLVEQGEKFDMIFLDPAYFSKALIGGNRGIKEYEFMRAPEFKKAMKSVPDLIKNNDGHVYLMLSGARTAQQDMLPYLNAMNEVGLSVVGEGEYKKFFKNGKPVTNVRGEEAAAEKIFLFTKSGMARRGEKTLDNLNFRFVRPSVRKSYTTEKAPQLLNALITNSTLEGESVLDPFAGSGVTGAEAVKAGRQATLVEKSEKAVEDYIIPKIEGAQDTIQESRTDTEGTGQTAETVTTELVEEFGNNVNKTIEKGKLVIVDDVSQLPANIKMSSTANGAFDKKSGISYLVANRIQKGQARRILLHEIGEHYGLEKMVGKDYMSLLNRLKTLRKQNADVDAIFAQVQEQYPELKVNSKPFLQEVMAKVGESAPNNTLFRRMVGAVKNFLRRLGLYNVNKFSDTDIQDMILNSLRVSLAEATGTVTREQASGTPAVQMSRGRYDDYPYLPSSDVDMIIDLGGVDRREAQGVFAKANNYIQNLPAAQSGIGREIVSRLSTIPDYLAGAYVSFLSIPNKIELFAKELPALNNLLTFIQNKADIIKQGREEVSIRLRNADRITNKYKETPRGKKILEEWNTVLLELSRENVNPETIINDPAARAELERGTLIKGSRIYREKAIELVERYERLPKDLKDLANQIVNELKGRYNTLLETMIEAFPSAETQLRDRFTALNYYLPMVRKGDYWFKYMTKDGEEGKASATTPFLREQMKKKLAAQGATQFENFSRTQLAQVRGSAPAAFVENLKSAIEKNEALDTKSQIEIVKTIEEQYLALFPEQSLRNQETHRKGIPGYINDVLFAYGDTAPKIIASTANAKYNTQIINASNTINQDATDSESAIIRAIGRDTIKSVPFYINPVANPFAAMPAYASYVWFLGGNISSAVVNITQLPLIVMPFLQGEYGFDASQKALFKAMKLYTEGGFEENREFLPDRTAAPFKVDPKTGKKTYSGKNAELFKEGGKYYNLFKDAEQAAALRRGVGYEITELRKNLGDEVTAGTKIKTKVEAGVGYIFQNSERLNREITLIAAFDLARSKGMSEKDAIQKAIELTSKVHSHALPEVGPRLFQDGLGKVTFVFKRFAQAQIYLVSKLFKDVFGAKPKNEAEQRAKDIARNQLLGVYGYSFLMAGVQGMPFYGGATILASLLFDDEDDPLDPHTAVNQAVGNFAYRGPLSNLVGIDISQRTGFRDLVFREDPARLEKIGAAAYMLEVLGGPGYSAVRRFTEGVGDVANGEIGRGAEKMLPTALGNTLKTVRYNTEGMTNRYGVPIIEGDPSVYESFMQLVGFTNIELSEAYTEANALRGPERKLQKRRSHLLLKYFLAKQTGDTGGMENIQKEIDAFNKKAPRGFTITPSVRNRSMRSREERLKNSVKGVYISKTRRPGLEERYSFDD